jgi:hypothetical protein
MAAVQDILRQPPPRRAALRDLMAELLSQNPFDRRCAADLARRLSARQPGILSQYADALFDLVAKLPPDQWQVRGWITMAAALNARTHTQRMRLAALVRSMSQDKRVGVRAMALEAFTVLAAAEPSLRDEVMPLIEQARMSESVAMQMRARRMLRLPWRPDKLGKPRRCL